MNPLVYGVNSNPFVVKNSEIVEIVVNNHDVSIYPLPRPTDTHSPNHQSHTPSPAPIRSTSTATPSNS